MDFDEVIDPRPVTRVVGEPGAHRDQSVWPATIPAVAQVLDDGIELADVTFLVGENGSGKSTLVEGIAMAFGLSPEGGSTGARHSTFSSESSLHTVLRLVRGGGSSRWGYFLRAETMHGLFTYLAHNPGSDPPFHARSHGESFSDMLSTSRYSGPGFFVLDEPESGLSFDAQLRLLARLHRMAGRRGCQVLVATHSPILASLPGARIYELGEQGISRTEWTDLAVVDHHRRYLESPESYLRHLLD